MSDPTEDQAAKTDGDPTSEADETSVVDQPPATQEAPPEEETDEVEKTEEQLSEEKAEKLKEAIGVAVEDIGALRQRLTVTIPREIIEERLAEQFSELQRERDVRGFRRGRAPRRLVEKAYGSEVRELLKEQLVGQAFLAATEKQEIDVLGDPDLDFDKIELPTDADLEFSCEVEVKPEFELPEVKGIPVRKPTVTVTDEDVDRQIEQLRMRFGNYDPVEDEQVQLDDMVVADIRMSVDEKVVHEETNAQFAARPSRVEGIVVEKLGETLVGAKVDDERSLEVDVPDDHQDEELRGKRAQLEFKIRDVKRLVMPPLDDEFAQTVGLDGVSELKTMVRAESESRIDQEIQRAMRLQVRTYLADKTELEIPAGLSSRQTERVVQQRMVELQRRGVPESEVEKHLDELQTTARQQAANEIKMFFILEKLGEKLELEVSEDEINGQIAQIAQSSRRRFDRVRDELIRRGGLQALYISIRDEKCIDQLLEDAEVSEITPEQADAESQETETEDKTEPNQDDLSDET